MQTEKIQLKSIQVESLNSECLLAVNRCVRYLKQRHGHVLLMQDKEVLVKLSSAVRQFDDEELRQMYRDLKQKLTACVTEQRSGSSKR